MTTTERQQILTFLSDACNLFSCSNCPFSRPDGRCATSELVLLSDDDLLEIATNIKGLQDILDNNKLGQYYKLYHSFCSMIQSENADKENICEGCPFDVLSYYTDEDLKALPDDVATDLIKRDCVTFDDIFVMSNDNNKKEFDQKELIPILEYMVTKIIEYMRNQEPDNED